MKVSGYEFNRSKQVKYLGSIVTEKNVTKKEVVARMVSGNKCFYGISKILSRITILVIRNEKTVIYNLLLRPFVTYGAETWKLRKNEERKLMIFERKIFGPTKNRETGEWRIRKNNELESLFKKENILIKYSVSNCIYYI